MDMPEPMLAAKAAPFAKLLIKITGTDEETLRLCPTQDWDNVKAVGEIMALTAAYQTALFAVISHRLFAASGQIRPELVLASLFIAGFIMTIDSYMVMRSGWHLSGIEELKRGGLDVSGGPAAHIKASVFLVIRIALAAGIAQLTAVFLSLLIFGADILSRVHDTYLRANAGLVSEATAIVDTDIQRATDALRGQETRVEALGRQIGSLRQKQIDVSPVDPQEQQAVQEIAALVTQRMSALETVQRAETFASDEAGGIKRDSENSGQAGSGPRHRAALEEVANARRHAGTIDRALIAARKRLDDLRKQNASAIERDKQQAQERIPEFERDLAIENTKLTALKNQLAHSIQNRDDSIRDAVERAPNHVPVNNGMLAQIVALEGIANTDPKIAAVIVLIDFVAFGFELAAVLAKVTSFVPMTYSALLARDAYLRVVRMVDDMMKELDRKKDIDHLDVEIPMQEQEVEDTAPAFSEDRREADRPHEPGPLAEQAATGTQLVRRPRGRPRKTVFN